MEFDLLPRLKSYTPFDKKEEECVLEIIEFLEHGENQFVRANLEKHIVASGYLLNESLDKILLTHHKALGIWLPFGGHSDGESNSLSVALREVSEESGITDIDVCGGEIFDVDIHTIPENKRKNEPEHKHLDIRFIFLTKQKEFTVSSESDSLAWFDIGEFEAMIKVSDYFSGTGRVIAKLNKFIKERKMKKTTKVWDKTFELSDSVAHRKVSFKNRFGIELVADEYMPKNASGKLPAIAVCGPFGAVKEQASGLYAMTMAECGFLTIAFDPSFTGESGGEVRYVASPDINTEDFQAAVDYLRANERVDGEKIGIIGICGWGGIALNTAAIDTRIKATVASTMYDMCRVNAYGYFDALDEKGRQNLRESLNAQRDEDFKNQTYKLAGGVVDPLPDDAPFFVKDYYDYYKTKRGYHARSLNSNGGWNVTSALSFVNAKLLSYSSEIKSAVLVVHGDKAHSCYFSKDAFKKLKGRNKELLLIPNAVHTDLYDRLNIIPFDKITNFFTDAFSGKLKY